MPKCRHATPKREPRTSNRKNTATRYKFGHSRARVVDNSRACGLSNPASPSSRSYTRAIACPTLVPPLPLVRSISPATYEPGQPRTRPGLDDRVENQRVWDAEIGPGTNHTVRGSADLTRSVTTPSHMGRDRGPDLTIEAVPTVVAQ
ncbi:unnamed protein product [Rhizoctonia solani]|uniref:Uncharacterized protein n=1 Tax=Rhizoctonia solani TaxID=456999 RepID=A0A8H3DPF4_9AGAM|nr:unnamed protein product [Rhizoctonia solani]